MVREAGGRKGRKEQVEGMSLTARRALVSALAGGGFLAVEREV